VTLTCRAGCAPASDDPPRLEQVALERVIRDLIEQDADPTPRRDTAGKSPMSGDSSIISGCKPSATGTHSKPAIVAVVLGKHREAALALLDEEAGRAVKISKGAGKRPESITAWKLSSRAPPAAINDRTPESAGLNGSGSSEAQR
jgi:hypothetical protein